MNALGLSLIMKMGCFCSREVIFVNNTKYEIKERLGEGYSNFTIICLNSILHFF